MASIITNIQKFSISDGNGIRTSIFFKGCGLKCAWCHNPENISYKKELLHDYEKCNKCGKCLQICPNDSLSIEGEKLKIERNTCDACGLCTEYCTFSAMEVAGREYTVNDIMQEIEKDLIFYEKSGGGVTLSGGESMTQNIDFLEQLCRELKQNGLHIAVDTSGHAPTENFRRLIPYIDIFLFDIKIMDSKKHERYVGQDNSLLIKNLKLLKENKSKINIRIPIIEGVNAREEEITEIIDFLGDTNIRPVQINLLPYHQVGTHKYFKLNMSYSYDLFKIPTKEKMEKLKEMFIQSGFTNVFIGG